MFDSKCLAVALIAFFGCAVPLLAEPNAIEPLVSKEKVEQLAAKCDAKITITYAPNYDEETGVVEEKAMLMVGVERSNSAEAIVCMRDHLPTVVTTLVGREKGVPPLSQAILDDVLKKCKWRKTDGFVGFVGDDELQFQPDPKADYDRVDCVLQGIKPYAPRMGFVGNEAYSAEEEQK
jgi:hypothetical protein